MERDLLKKCAAYFAKAPTNQAGYITLLNWARAFGNLQRAGVEGTETYGAGLTRVLREPGVKVLEVNRPVRSARRLQEKSDSVDAEKIHPRYLSVLPCQGG
jgi:transposase